MNFNEPSIFTYKGQKVTLVNWDFCIYMYICINIHETSKLELSDTASIESALKLS